MSTSGLIGNLYGVKIMNREIKFRAWGRTLDSDAPIMTKPFGLGEYSMVNEGAQERLLPTVGEDVVYMQYTGLKDKNGVEIYEGDIIRSRISDGSIYEVEYLPTAFYLKNIPDIDSGNTLGYDGEDFEVIGNIYENPELLKEKV